MCIRDRCWTYNTKESIRFAEEAVKEIFANLEKVYQEIGRAHV